MLLCTALIATLLIYVQLCTVSRFCLLIFSCSTLLTLWEKSRRERETKGSEVREGGREGRGREGERERRRGKGRSEGGKEEGRRVREKGGAKNISIKAAYLTASLPLWLTCHHLV